MISVYAYHMCSVLFLPVQSLLMCFRSSLTRFADFSLITLPQTLRLFYVPLRSQAPQQQYTVHCMHYSITLWAYLSEPLIKDSHQHLNTMKKPTLPHAQVTWSHIIITYVLWRGIRKHCMWRKWLTWSRFITLLTFELSSFREIAFYCISLTVAADNSCWTTKSTRRQNRKNGHTQRHTRQLL